MHSRYISNIKYSVKGFDEEILLLENHAREIMVVLERDSSISRSLICNI